MNQYNKIFKKDYKYKRKFINACILRIRHGRRSHKTIIGYKTYIFKSMKNIVNKNIYNYIRLLEGSPCRNVPEYNEILSECYLIFDNCVEKFKISKNNNFYFYFNKAMSRRFYKLYKKEVNMKSTELSDEMTMVLPALSNRRNVDTVELLLYNLGIEGIDKEICLSRIRGEKGTEFLRKNKDVSQKQYNTSLKKIRTLLKDLIAEKKY